MVEQRVTYEEWVKIRESMTAEEWLQCQKAALEAERGDALGIVYGVLLVKANG